VTKHSATPKLSFIDWIVSASNYYKFIGMRGSDFEFLYAVGSYQRLETYGECYWEDRKLSK
jgi:hypothetical protein